LNDYNLWLKSNHTKTFKAKYFKGLGTSTAVEAREALTDIDKKIITFETDVETDNSMNLAFDKKLTDSRKLWLMERYNPNDNIDRTQAKVSVSNYINKELIHFSYYDNQRSIPNIMDGFKPSQRKIMHTACKYLGTSEMKVAQFGAKVAEKTDYHHGEVSIMGTVINMGQNYVGSNNINLLEPLGAFGSRLNASDAASPRYIFTKLTDIAKKIFDSRDSQLLKYLISDGISIEPEWFVPIIPTILVNGTIGIGSGFSTEVLKYNPNDLSEYIMNLLNGKKPAKNLKPWYRGFKGTIERLDTGKYRTIGCYSFDDAKRTIHITELPIGVWTDDYKDFIEGMLSDKNEPSIIDIRHGSSDVIVSIEIVINPKMYGSIREMNTEDFLQKFKLISKLSCTNMYLFNHDRIITKYANVYEILKEFYTVRLDFYVRRRDAIIAFLKYELTILENKVKFIEHVKSGKIKLQKIADSSLLSYLIENNFDQDQGVHGSQLENPTLKEYSYLVDMPIRSITNENALKYKKYHEAKELELKSILKITASEMWKKDLSELIDLNNEINLNLEQTNASSKLVKISTKKRLKKN
jgi:DNA topoisomerase-2